jgi:DNA adenine methylase
MTTLIPYIGGKHRLSREIARHLRATGAETLVEVFGGSAAVMLNAGFQKRVYNDANGDMVNVFRMLADPGKCAAVQRLLALMPPSRELFAECQSCPPGTEIERAARTLYLQLFAFGGKGINGGFQVSLGDRQHIKEVLRYRRVQQRLGSFVEFFGATVIENLDYQECIRIYGRNGSSVLFCDPPYLGTQHYYRGPRFTDWDHWNMAQMLNGVAAHVVLTCYDHPQMRAHYPDDRWTWTGVDATKNRQFRCGLSTKTREYIVVRRS